MHHVRAGRNQVAALGGACRGVGEAALEAAPEQPFWNGLTPRITWRVAAGETVKDVADRCPPRRRTAAALAARTRNCARALNSTQLNSTQLGSAPGLQGRRRYTNIQRAEWGTTPHSGLWW